MFPSLVSHNQRYSRYGNAKSLGKGRIFDALRRECAYGANLLLGELWRTTSCVARCIAATFGIHIAHVVAFCAREQVIGVATSPVGYVSWRVIHVAFVERVHAVGKRAMMQLVTKAMGIDDLVFDVQYAVAITSSALPVPTFIPSALIDHRPEALFWRKSSGFRVVALKIAMVGFANWFAAAAFTVVWRDLLSVHRCNYTANYTCRGWQKVDSLSGEWR